MSIEIQKKEKLMQQEQWAYLSTHPSKHFCFCYDDDDDNEDYTSAITPDEPVLSTEEPGNSQSMRDEHLDTIPATESNDFIKSSVEDLIQILSESEGIPDHRCDVPSHDNSPPLNISKDQFEDLSESNEEFSSTDDDSFSFDKIDYVEASPPDSELVSSEVMEIVIPEVGGIEASNDNSIPFYDPIISGTPSNLTPSVESNFFLESCFDEDVLEKIILKPLSEEEIIPMKSLRTHDSSLLILSKIDSLLDKFAGELTLLKSILSGIDETDCDYEEDIRLIEKLLYDNSFPRPLEEFVSANSDAKKFVSDNSNADIKSLSPSPVPIKDSDFYMEEIDLSLNPVEPNSRDFTMDVVENISSTKEPQVLNTLPTHPTLQLNLKFQPFSESLFAYVVKERSRKGQNRIKTGQKREAWRSRKNVKAVTVDKGRKTEENAKRMVKNARTGVIPMIKFMKESGCPNATKVNNTKNTRKPTMKYTEMYRNTSQSPRVRGDQRNWNNQKSQQLGKDFMMQNKACYNYGSFDHLEFNYNHDTWVDKGKTWTRVNHAQDNMKYTSTHKSMTPKVVLLKSGTKPIDRPFSTGRPTLKRAQPKITSFVKTTHSNVKGFFERKSVAKNKVWSPTVRSKIPTIGLKVPTAKPIVATDKGNKEKDNGCSRGKITSKGSIKAGKLEFENVYFVEELKYNLFSVSQIYDNKNSVLFIDVECLVLGKDFKLVDDKHVLLRSPIEQNMYTIDLKNVVPHKILTCLIAKALVNESMLWHRRSDNVGQFRNKEMDEFCSMKGITREFSNARTPQQNGVAERRNKTLIEAARTMLVYAKLPITFWGEAVNTACYV
nr:ribonuclease H-like domain-containing protein [Tanacetum cinerariifolium]